MFESIGFGCVVRQKSMWFPFFLLFFKVTCRAIGIGAYLVRLGQRTIQVENSHIILTGCGALNKVSLCISVFRAMWIALVFLWVLLEIQGAATTIPVIALGPFGFLPSRAPLNQGGELTQGSSCETFMPLQSFSLFFSLWLESSPFMHLFFLTRTSYWQPEALFQASWLEIGRGPRQNCRFKGLSMNQVKGKKEKQLLT